MGKITTVEFWFDTCMILINRKGKRGNGYRMTPERVLRLASVIKTWTHHATGHGERWYSPEASSRLMAFWRLLRNRRLFNLSMDADLPGARRKVRRARRQRLYPRWRRQ